MWRIRLLVAVLASWAFPADAGSPMPCDGTETVVCHGGVLVKQCCPKGKKCNFRNPPHIACGNGYCAEGKDVGRCPAPQAATTAAKSEAECKGEYGDWAEVCVARKVTKACLPSMPTNFTGPPLNPPFRTCGPKDERCTTSQFIEDCHPVRGEVTECAGTWTKVCLGGKVAERCLPWTVRANPYTATQYVKCPDGSCVIGNDKNLCWR